MDILLNGRARLNSGNKVKRMTSQKDRKLKIVGFTFIGGIALLGFAF